MFLLKNIQPPTSACFLSPEMTRAFE